MLDGLTFDCFYPTDSKNDFTSSENSLITFKVACPAALAIAFPPKVLKWRELLANASAISGVVTAIASGKPLPIPVDQGIR